MNMDAVIGVSDSAPELMNLLFNTGAGLEFLARRCGIAESELRSYARIGISGLANIQTAIKYAKHNDLEQKDVLICVATDGATLYRSELEPAIQRYFGGEFGEAQAAEAFGRCLAGCEPAHVLENDAGRAQADLQPGLLHLG